MSAERCFEQAYGDEPDLEQLRLQDQLNIERAAGRSFLGFEEGLLSFRPTYKFQPGTDLYEQRPEKKLRTPAWCDRILWRCGEGVDPRHLRQARGIGRRAEARCVCHNALFTMQLYYGAATELKTSDHKPVHAVFEVGVADRGFFCVLELPPDMVLSQTQKVCAKTTIEDRRAAVSTNITQKLDSMENRTLPRVLISEEAIQVNSPQAG